MTVHYVPGGDRTLESGYDRFGNRKSLVFTDGSDVLTHAWTYNKLNRLVEADLASPSPLEFGYLANDDLETVTHGNGVETDYTYFPEGSVESITAASPSEQLLELTYTIDKVLNITGLTEQHDAAATNHAYSYGYDPLDRLASASYPTALGLPASEAFAYDAAGNREDPSSASAYDYDANNRITASPGKAWVYDGDGNPVSVNAGLGSEETFAHDAQNRMRGYTSASSSTAASYLHDPLARRIRKTVNGTSTWFVWDGDQLLAEFDGSGDRDRRYTYADGFAPVEQAVATGPSSEKVQQVHADHLDTPRGLSGATGDGVWRAAYHAFGSTTPDEDPDDDLSDTRFAIRFPGQFADLESSLHYNRYRYYHPPNGRYLTIDPIFRYLQTNLYTYAVNTPTSLVDASGLTVTNPTDRTVIVKPESGPMFKLPPRTCIDISPDGVFDPATGKWTKFYGKSWLPDNDVEVDPDEGPQCVSGPCSVLPEVTWTPGDPDERWRTPADDKVYDPTKQDYWPKPNRAPANQSTTPNGGKQ